MGREVYNKRTGALFLDQINIPSWKSVIKDQLHCEQRRKEERSGEIVVACSEEPNNLADKFKTSD